MPKPEIIGSARSTYTWAVCMVCEEKGIEHALVERPLRAPEIIAIHPLGKMPVLRHGQVELFESKAIAAYLDRMFPGPQVFPSDPRHAALTEQWVSLVNTVIDRTLIRAYLSRISPQRPPMESLTERRSKPLCRQFASSWEFLAGVTVRGLGEGSTSVKSTVHSAKVNPLFLVSGDCWVHQKRRACSA